MNNTITANDLKIKGISIAENLAKQGLETIITVRGKAKYVILDTEQYNKLKEYELTIALSEAKQDIKDGRYNKDSINDHIKRIENV